MDEREAFSAYFENQHARKFPRRGTTATQEREALSAFLAGVAYAEMRNRADRRIGASGCRPDEDDPEFCAAHEDGMFKAGEMLCDEAPDRTNRSEDDEFAPGECDGSSTCSAPIHVHGCYAPHRSDQCDSPDEYGHTDRTNGSER